MTLVSRGRVISLSNQSAAPQTIAHTCELGDRGRVVSEDVAEAARQAERLVALAEAEIAAMHAQFERESGNIRAEMRAQTRAEVELQFVRQFLDLSHVRQEVMQRAEQEIVVIARLLAERVITEELTLHPERLLALTRQILRESRGARMIAIHSAPQVAEQLQGEVEKLTMEANASITVLADEALGYGDFRIETDVGSLDARISTQVAHLASVIVESIRS